MQSRTTGAVDSTARRHCRRRCAAAAATTEPQRQSRCHPRSAAGVPQKVRSESRKYKHRTCPQAVTPGCGFRLATSANGGQFPRLPTHPGIAGVARGPSTQPPHRGVIFLPPPAPTPKRRARQRGEAGPLLRRGRLPLSSPGPPAWAPPPAVADFALRPLDPRRGGSTRTWRLGVDGAAWTPPVAAGTHPTVAVSPRRGGIPPWRGRRSPWPPPPCRGVAAAPTWRGRGAWPPLPAVATSPAVAPTPWSAGGRRAAAVGCGCRCRLRLPPLLLPPPLLLAPPPRRCCCRCRCCTVQLFSSAQPPPPPRRSPTRSPRGAWPPAARRRGWRCSAGPPFPPHPPLC